MSYTGVVPGDSKTTETKKKPGVGKPNPQFVPGSQDEIVFGDSPRASRQPGVRRSRSLFEPLGVMNVDQPPKKIPRRPGQSEEMRGSSPTLSERSVSPQSNASSITTLPYPPSQQQQSNADPRGEPTRVRRHRSPSKGRSEATSRSRSRSPSAVQRTKSRSKAAVTEAQLNKQTSELNAFYAEKARLEEATKSAMDKSAQLQAELQQRADQLAVSQSAQALLQGTLRELQEQTTKGEAATDAAYKAEKQISAAQEVELNQLRERLTQRDQQEAKNIALIEHQKQEILAAKKNYDMQQVEVEKAKDALEKSAKGIKQNELKAVIEADKSIKVREELRASHARVAVLERQATDLSSQISDLTASAGEADQRAASAQGELKTLKQANAGLQGDLTRSRLEVDGAKQRADQLQSLLDKSAVSNRAATTERDRLSQEVQRLNDLLSAARRTSGADEIQRQKDFADDIKRAGDAGFAGGRQWIMSTVVSRIADYFNRPDKDIDKKTIDDSLAQLTAYDLEVGTVITDLLNNVWARAKQRGLNEKQADIDKLKRDIAGYVNEIDTLMRDSNEKKARIGELEDDLRKKSTEPTAVARAQGRRVQPPPDDDEPMLGLTNPPGPNPRKPDDDEELRCGRLRKAAKNDLEMPNIWGMCADRCWGDVVAKYMGIQYNMLYPLAEQVAYIRSEGKKYGNLTLQLGVCIETWKELQQYLHRGKQLQLSKGKATVLYRVLMRYNDSYEMINKSAFENYEALFRDGEPAHIDPAGLRKAAERFEEHVKSNPSGFFFKEIWSKTGRVMHWRYNAADARELLLAMDSLLPDV